MSCPPPYHPFMLPVIRLEIYPKIGQFLKEAAQGYVEEWKASKKSGK
jgi:hypothetical protein